MAKRETRLFLTPTEKLGLTRLEAAAFIGVTPSAWDDLVANGDMPQARRLGAFERWDRRQVEAAFSLAPQAEDARKPGPYSDVA
ncbi:MAG: hypothetical protein P4L76_05320 [Beijerinckiaceae bacterium]|nr:hypothetical protein [Beijerinckiaceae bacterium]